MNHLESRKLTYHQKVEITPQYSEKILRVAARILEKKSTEESNLQSAQSV